MKKSIIAILTATFIGLVVPIIIFIANNSLQFFNKIPLNISLAIIALEFLIICFLIGLIISLIIKLNDKLISNFGVYWDKNYKAYCPNDKIPLEVFDEVRYKCTKCNKYYLLKSEDNVAYTLKSVKLYLRKKGQLVQKKIDEGINCGPSNEIKDDFKS